MQNSLFVTTVDDTIIAMMMTLVDAAAPVPVGTRRATVLGLLQASDRPRSAAEVADVTGLHLNTARFHLDRLVEDGLARRAAEPRDAPGRPRILYSVESPATGPRSYGLLAEMLTGLVGSLADSGPAAIGAGRAWGRHLVERAAPSQPVDADEAITRLNRVLEAVGFQPETQASKTKGSTEVRLRHCPFREVAERHTDVVCALHLGLMQGALDELHTSVEATSLEPFVAPNLCIAQLRTHAPAR